MTIILFSDEVQLEEIEFNLFYKYLTQKRKILNNKGKMITILEKLINRQYEIKEVINNDSSNNNNNNNNNNNSSSSSSGSSSRFLYW